MKRILFFLLLISSLAHGQVGNPFFPKIFNVKSYGAKGDGTTDDTQGIQLAINDCAAKGGGVVWFPIGIYFINGSIQTAVGAQSIDMESQIYIPWDSAFSGVVTIQLVGESGASPGNIIQSPFTPQNWRDMGVTLYSGYTGTRASTNKGLAIIGTGELTAGAFNLNSFTVKNINFKVKANPNGAGPEIGGVNGKHTVGFSVDNCAYVPDAIATSFVLPIRDISAFETPETGGGASYAMSNLSACGVKWGFIFGEHVSANQVSSAECYNAFGLKGAGHASTFQRINSYWCTNGFSYYPYGANSSGLPVVFSALQFDMEYAIGNSGKYWNTSLGVKDTANLFQANISYAVIEQGVGLVNSLWAVSGATGVVATAIGTAPSGFGFDGISVYSPSTTGSVVVTKNNAGDHGYGFTNANAAGAAHVQLIGDTYQTEFIQKSSGYAAYGILVANSSEWYTNSVAGIAVMVDAAGPFKIATGTGAPAASRFEISSAGSLKFDAYGAGTFTGTATKNLAVDASGNVIEVATGAGTPGGSVGDIQWNNTTFAGGGPTYNSTTGTIVETKNNNGDNGIEFTNANASGAGHLRVTGDTYLSELIQKSSTTTAYGALVANSSGWYSGATHQVIMSDNAAGEVDIAVGATPATMIKVTAGGMMTFVTPTTTLASINLPAGTKKTTMVDGDFLHSSGHLYFHDGTTDYDLLSVAGLSGLTANQIQYATSGTAIGGNANLTVDVTNKAIQSVHFVGLGSAPTQASLGTNVTSITITGNDVSYSVSVVTSGAVSGTIFSVNLANAYAVAPHPLVTSGQFSTAVSSLAAGGGTSTNTVAGSIAGSGTYIINVHNF